MKIVEKSIQMCIRMASDKKPTRSWQAAQILSTIMSAAEKCVLSLFYE
jgi:hypothetical protein